MAGAAGVLAGQPLDTVRVRMQQPRCAWRSAAAGLRSVAAAEGGGALFKGVTYPLVSIGFQARSHRITDQLSQAVWSTVDTCLPQQKRTSLPACMEKLNKAATCNSLHSK